MLVGVLTGMALLWTLWRVWLPIGVAAPGRPVLEVPMGWRERWRWHRRNLYALAALALLGALGGWMPVALQGMVIAFALLTLGIPIRYRFTTEGVALNNVLFRRWEEFEGYRMERWGIRMVGREGKGSFCLYLPLGARERARAVVAGCLRRSARRCVESPAEIREVLR